MRILTSMIYIYLLIHAVTYDGDLFDSGWSRSIPLFFRREIHLSMTKCQCWFSKSLLVEWAPETYELRKVHSRYGHIKDSRITMCFVYYQILVSGWCQLRSTHILLLCSVDMLYLTVAGKGWNHRTRLVCGNVRRKSLFSLLHGNLKLHCYMYLRYLVYCG